MGSEFRPKWVQPPPGHHRDHPADLNWKCSAGVPAGSRASSIDVDGDDIVAVVARDESGKLTKASISHLERRGFKRSASKAAEAAPTKEGVHAAPTEETATEEIAAQTAGEGEAAT